VARRRSPAKARSQSESSELVLRYVTIASVIVGLLLAILQGRPASAIAAIVIIGLGFTNVTIYLWRKRLPSGYRKYGWERWCAAGVAVGIVCAVATANAFPLSRAFFIYNVLGFQNSSSLTRMGAPTFAQSAKFVRILFFVDNKATFAQELTQLALTLTWGGVSSVSNCSESPLTYKFRLLSSGSVAAESGAAAGFRVPVTGKASQYCGGGKLTIHFNPPALILEKSSVSIISIDVPRRVKVTYVDPPSRSNKNSPESIADLATVLIPTAGADVTIKLHAKTDSGTVLSACSEVLEPGSERGQISSC